MSSAFFHLLEDERRSFRFGFADPAPDAQPSVGIDHG
jgi:hypothetical protein